MDGLLVRMGVVVEMIDLDDYCWSWNKRGVAGKMAFEMCGVLDVVIGTAFEDGMRDGNYGEEDVRTE